MVGQVSDFENGDQGLDPTLPLKHLLLYGSNSAQFYFPVQWLGKNVMLL